MSVTNNRFVHFTLPAGVASIYIGLSALHPIAPPRPEIVEAILYHEDDNRDGFWSDATPTKTTAPVSKIISSPRIKRDPSNPTKAVLLATAPKVDRETYLLALTMWGEARGDGAEAMRAVGHVIMNRIRSVRRFGASIAAVVWKKRAFSCWDDINREKMRSLNSLPHDSVEYQSFVTALQLAQRIVHKGDRDPTGGSIFYHSRATKPNWSRGIEPLRAIAHHVFFDRDAKAE